MSQESPVIEIPIEPTVFESNTQAEEIKESSLWYCHSCLLNDFCVANQFYCAALFELSNLESRLRTARHLIGFVLSAQGLN